MGFIDLGGSLGRKFGSIGVGINEISTRIVMEPAKRLEVTGMDSSRALSIARLFTNGLGLAESFHIDVQQAIPHHAGLGSGTQLALAIGAGISRLFDLGLEIDDIVGLVGRGARSGIGIAVFDHGGLVVDSGRGANTQTPPVISRLNIPEEWRFLVLLDHNGSGLHGDSEVAAFGALPEFPEQEAARLCHLLMMRGLPAVLEGDVDAFGSVITELQISVGDHFAPVQGGRFTSPRVRDALDFLASRGAVAIGQSSWGPTGFCLVDSPARAAMLRTELDQKRVGGGLECLICTPRREGAVIRTLATASA